MAELRTHRELVEKSETSLVSALIGLPSHYTVLPHLILPRQEWRQEPDDIDAVVIGPSGVFLIDYKDWHGAITIQERGPWRHNFVAGGFDERANPLPHLHEKARCLAQFLASCGHGDLLIRVALVFPERSTFAGLAGADVSGVPLMHLNEVNQHIARMGAVAWMNPDIQLSIAEHLRPNSPRRLVNQYQLTSLLSRSEGKSTYLAYDTVLARPVLLQELSYDPYQAPAQLERVRNELLREAKLTMQLRHRHIVNVEHVLPRDDCYYVVTEWIDQCQTLAERVRAQVGQAMPISEVVSVVEAIAEALEYAHSHGIVHRDIRPENILVAPSGVVKVANFGLAKKADLATLSTFDLRQMAQENPFVAPEFRIGAAGHHRVDQRADIYSLGAILYQLLTGHIPHHLDEQYFEPPSRLNPAVTPELDEVVEKALRFDPAQRFSTVHAFKERLVHYRDPRSSEALRYIQRKLVKRTRNSLVYQAFDTKLQRQVGLKKLLLNPHLSEAERQVQLSQLLREAQLASSLVHPHIVSVFDHFLEDGDGYIVMEWLEGLNLREALDSKVRLTLPQIKQLASQVSEALQYAHSQGVVHRDIKPENIIFHEGQATVLDFGIAHTLDRTQPADIQKTAGTARYMAPEVLAGATVDVRADIFSLGVVLYELLTGQYPYEASVIMARYTAVLLAPPPAPSALNIDCPTELDDVLARALQVDPERRYPTLADFRREFLALEHRVPHRHRRGNWGYGTLVWIAGTVFIVFTGLGVWMTQTIKSQFSMPTQQLPVLPVASASDIAPMALASATPTQEPTPSPSVTPNVPARWESAPITVDGVTVAVDSVAWQDRSCRVTLRVDNQSADTIQFLNRSDRPELFRLVDSLGNDYSSALELTSVDIGLLMIEARTRVRGSFTLKSLPDARAQSLTLTLKEYEGKGRKFDLNALPVAAPR